MVVWYHGKMMDVDARLADLKKGGPKSFLVYVDPSEVPSAQKVRV